MSYKEANYCALILGDNVLDTITFTTFQLIIGGVTPSIETLTQLVTCAQNEYAKHGEHYRINHKVDNTKSYYWFYAEYGKPLPLPDSLYDVDKHVTTKNLRQQNQAELRSQLFAIYNMRSNLLYLSNSKKCGFLEEYFKTYLKTDITIKKIYTSAEDFLKIVQLIDSIKLISFNNDLFTQNTGLFDDSRNIFGLGNPEQLSIELKFLRAAKTPSFVERFLNWKERIAKCELDNLICVGFNDKNMEVIFNTDSFSNKIEVKAQKNNNGMYLDHFVEESLVIQMDKYDV